MARIRTYTSVSMGTLSITVYHERCLFPERFLISTVSKWKIGNEAWLMNERGRFRRWRIYGYFGTQLALAKAVATVIESTIALQDQRPYFIYGCLWGNVLGCNMVLNRSYSEYNIRLRDMLVERLEQFELPKN